MKKSEIRKHYFLNEYVIIAPKRNFRPQEISKEDQEKKKKFGKFCFFCPGHEDEKSIYEVVEKDKWIIKVLPNKFPALTLDNKKAFGKQEIVVETPDHNKDLPDLSIDHVVKILEVFNERIWEISKIEGIKYIQIFKNDGGKAGASVPHSHSQIIALPIIPPKIQNESEEMDKYKIKHKSCPYCDIIKKELKERIRIVYNDENIVAFCPYSSLYAYGVWMMPKCHRRTIGDLSMNEKYSFAKALKSVLDKLEDNNMAYNFYLHNSLDLEDHHFRLKISPRVNTWAGLELGSGVVINPIPPEDAAKFYKNKQ